RQGPILLFLENEMKSTVEEILGRDSPGKNRWDETTLASVDAHRGQHGSSVSEDDPTRERSSHWRTRSTGAIIRRHTDAAILTRFAHERPQPHWSISASNRG